MSVNIILSQRSEPHFDGGWRVRALLVALIDEALQTTLPLDGGFYSTLHQDGCRPD
jgi:hypothetical protein